MATGILRFLIEFCFWCTFISFGLCADDPNLDCEIWLAPSTITGAGLGIYAGKDYLKGDLLLSCGDSLVPIIDYKEHAQVTGKDHLLFLWDEYTWDSMGLMANEEGRFSVSIASPGFGSAANSFLPLYNVEEWYGLKDTAGLHRSRDPGVGAFSPYYDRKSTAKKSIRAGQEFFVSCKLRFTMIVFIVNSLQSF
jgi:hypothetical protein